MNETHTDCAMFGPAPGCVGAVTRLAVTFVSVKFVLTPFREICVTQTACTIINVYSHQQQRTSNTCYQDRCGIGLKASHTMVIVLCQRYTHLDKSPKEKHRQYHITMSCVLHHRYGEMFIIRWFPGCTRH